MDFNLIRITFYMRNYIFIFLFIIPTNLLFGQDTIVPLKIARIKNAVFEENLKKLLDFSYPKRNDDVYFLQFAENEVYDNNSIYFSDYYTISKFSKDLAYVIIDEKLVILENRNVPSNLIEVICKTENISIILYTNRKFIPAIVVEGEKPSYLRLICTFKIAGNNIYFIKEGEF